MRNLTEGSPLRLILSFSLPLLLGNFLQQLYNVTDAVLVGRALGAQALAGVGAASSVMLLVIGFCTGATAGFSVPVARFFGAGDEGKMRERIFQGALLSLALAALLTALTTVFCSDILRLLQTPAAVFPEAYVYLFLIFLGIPFTVLYNFLAGILRAVGDSRTPLFMLLASTALNVGLDALLILVIPLGVTGAALATVLAQAASAVLCLIVIAKRVKSLIPRKEERRLTGAGVGELLGMGLPMGFQYSITAIGSMLMQAANNALGGVYVVAFTMGMRVKQLVLAPFDALATGLSNFCSQNRGARRADRISQGVRRCFAVGLGYAAVMGLLLIFAGGALSQMFLDASETGAIAASAQYLRTIGCFLWCVWILILCRMTVQGLGFGGRSMLSGMMEMLARGAMSLLVIPVYGFPAVCFTDPVSWAAGSLLIAPICWWCLRQIKKSCRPD